VTRSLRVLPRAEAELAEAIDWYEARRPGLGADLLELAAKAFERIVEAPNQLATWRTGRREYSRFLIDRFPYAVLFTYDDVEVVIVAFAHCRRKPGYWLR
jgi:toxin ParE1/3/4